MKKILFTALAILLISFGTNASGNLKTTAAHAKFAASFKNFKVPVFTSLNFFSHYDSGSGQTWILVGNTTTMQITTAFYSIGGTDYYANYIDSGSSFSYVDDMYVFVVARVHYNFSDLGYFDVAENMIYAF